MPQDFQAVYEHGVFRPLTPVNLPDAARVELTLHGTDDRKTSLGQSVDNLLGAMSDEPELVDQVVESAMKARETYPLRAPEE